MKPASSYSDFFLFKNVHKAYTALRRFSAEEEIKRVQWEMFERVVKYLGLPTENSRGSEISTLVESRDCDVINIIREVYQNKGSLQKALATLYAPVHCSGDALLRSNRVVKTVQMLRKGFSRKNNEEEIKDIQWRIFENVVKYVGLPSSNSRVDNKDLTLERSCEAAKALRDSYSGRKELFKKLLANFYFPMHCVGEDILSLRNRNKKSEKSEQKTESKNSEKSEKTDKSETSDKTEKSGNTETKNE